MLRVLPLALLLTFAAADLGSAQPPFGPGFRRPRIRPIPGRMGEPNRAPRGEDDRDRTDRRGDDRRGPGRPELPEPRPGRSDAPARDRRFEDRDRDDRGRERDDAREDRDDRDQRRDDDDHRERRGDDRDRDEHDRRERFDREHERRSDHAHESEREHAYREASRAVEAELNDVAAALRSLDQSYMYKGFRNKNHAWVAGSSFNQNSVQILRLKARIRELELRLQRESTEDEECETDGCCGGFSWRAGQPLDGERRGRARFGDDGLELTRGSFVVGADAAENMTRACRESNELTIDAVFTPTSDEARGPARILSLSSDTGSRNFTLGQEADRLVLRLRTTETDENGTNPEVSLTRLVPGKRHHVVVTYRPGKLVCHLNGEQVLETGAVEGTFANWTEQRFVLGDELTGDRDWPGTLARFAVYDCVVPPGTRMELAPER